MTNFLSYCKNKNEFLEKYRSKDDVKKFKSEISQYLKENFIPTESPKFEQFESWFDGYLKNYIYKENINVKDNDFKDELLHKVDYLNSAQAKKRFDRMTWETLDSQVEQWEKYLQRRAENGDDPNGTFLASQLSNQWSGVELTTEKALSYEGGVMGHCVGSYGNKIESGKSRIFSLRDKKDESHVTVECDVSKNMIIQIQGKENKLPPEKYHEYIFEFAKERQMSFSPNLFEKFGIKQLGYEFIPKGEQYQKRLNEVLSGESDIQKGGVLDLRGEKCGWATIKGVWDAVYMNSTTDVNSVDNAQVKTLKVDGFSKELKIKNSKINNLNIKNAMLSDLSSVSVVDNLILKNTLVSHIPNYNLKNLNVINEGAISSLVSCEASADIFHINNAPNLTNIRKGHYKNIELENTGVDDLTEVYSDSVKIKNSPIKKVDLENFSDIEMENVSLEEIADLSIDNRARMMFNKCPNLKKINNIKAPNSSFAANNNNALKEVSSVTSASLDLRSNQNLESLEKIRTHRARFDGIDFSKVKAKRVNVRSIKTNDKEFLKTRKISSIMK